MNPKYDILFHSNVHDHFHRYPFCPDSHGDSNLHMIQLLHVHSTLVHQEKRNTPSNILQNNPFLTM